MSGDPNLNSGGACRNPMSSEQSFDFTDLYQNEESFDLTNYMSSGNLELCSDDLFQNLFPPTSPSEENPKKHQTVHDFDEELESWYQSASEPASNCASACSSAAPSPVPFNYYTPPVTPQSDRRPLSPHHLQFDGLTTPMSSSRFAAMQGEDLTSRVNLSKQWLSDPNGSVSSARKIVHLDHTKQSGRVHSNLPVVVKPDPDDIIQIEQPNILLQAQVKEEVRHPPLPLVSISQSSNIQNQPMKTSLKRPVVVSENPGSNKKTKTLEKGTIEYVQKRERNNVAVRRSRDKAKIKAIETQKKVEELSSENSQLHERVAELSHELNTLKNLLKSLHQVGA